MKVSAFSRSDVLVQGRPRPAPTVVYIIAVAYFVAHLPLLAPSLEDIDSINFALGLHHFDPANHQPHPPGYPVYVALGRVSLALLRALFPSTEAIRAEALALAIWSAVGGAVAIVGAWYVFQALERFRHDRTSTTSRGGSLWAVLLLAVSPLFWITGLRPMSDMPGLAVSLVAQALLLAAVQGRRSLVPGALATGVAAGLRSQTLILTLPLLVWAIVVDVKAGWRLLMRPAIAFLVGVLVWAIPLIAAAGGIQGYIRALGSQAGEDFAWVNMLWSTPTPRRLVFALYETFVLPWGSIPLAVLFGVAAGVGAMIMLVWARRALVVVGVAFGPYIVFHLLFQETVSVRYALPVVPAIALLSSRAIAAAGPLTIPVGIALSIYAGGVAVPAGISYGGQQHPAFRAITDIVARSKSASPAALYSHFALFRPLQAAAPADLKIVPPARNREWLGPVEYWRSGGEGAVWFLADPRRTNLALIDPQSRRDRTEYRWSVADLPELSGTRPISADWYRFAPPGWFAGEGWSLTAETGGLVHATATGVDHQPIEAFVRRRLEPVTIMIGGRHLGSPRDPPTEFTLSIDATAIDTWTFDYRTGPNFLRFVRLPVGIPTGPGAYARLTIAARSAAPGQPTPEVAIRQFDVQSAEFPIIGFDEGWHEDEYDVSTGLHWRWTSDRSILRIISERSVVLMIRGESPLKYFDAPPKVQVRVGPRVVAEFHPDRDFEWRIKIPADVLASASGAIAIEIDRAYLPGQAEGTGDTRRLGLRLFECVAEPTVD